jgi:hypothetical protein
MASSTWDANPILITQSRPPIDTLQIELISPISELDNQPIHPASFAATDLLK